MKKWYRFLAFGIVFCMMLQVLIVNPTVLAATTDVEVTSGTLSTDGSYKVLEFNFDKNVNSTATQIQASGALASEVKSKIIIANNTVGQINTGNDYNVMLHFIDGGNKLQIYIGGGYGVSSTNDFDFVISTDLFVSSEVTIKAVKFSFNSTSGLFTKALPQDANLTAGTYSEYNDGSTVWSNIMFSIDKNIGANTSNIQANASQLATDIKANVKIGGKAIGEINSSSDYNFMVHIANDGNSLQFFFAKNNSFGISPTNDYIISIAQDIQINAFLTLKAVNYRYYASTGTFEKTTDTVIAPTIIKSEIISGVFGEFTDDNNNNWIKLEFKLDKSTGADVSQIQATGALKEQIKNTIKLNGVTVAKVNEASDYNVMIHLIDGGTTIQIIMGKNNALGITNHHDFTVSFSKDIEVASNITIVSAKFKFSSASNSFAKVENVDDIVQVESKVANITSVDGINTSADGKYYIIKVLLDKVITTTQIGNIQSNSTYKDNIQNSIYINGKSLKTWFTEIGHEYATMITLQPTSEKTGLSYLEFWFDTNNTMGGFTR